MLGRGSSGACFSLRGLVLAMTKPRKLKHALLNSKKNGWRAPHPGQPRITLASRRKRLKRSLPLLRERTAAAAISSSLRVLEHEAAPHQVFLIVQRGVIQVKEALRVHEQARTVFFDH